MGRHKRIPTKNRKKLKSVDPFNKKAPALKHKVFSFQKSKEEVLVDKKEVKKRKQHKNKVLAEAEKIGIRKGRFETVSHFVRRVERMTYAAINEHEMLVKQGLVGRSESELEADFKLLEEKEKRMKEQKKNEIQNKIKAAREKREREAKLKEVCKKLKDVISKKSTSGILLDDDTVVKKKKKKLGGSDKIREKKKLAAEQARKEAVLNQRGERFCSVIEVIAFGERYDAPPDFKGAMKKEMNPLMAKAGAKKLLLHSLLHQNSNGSKTKYLDDGKREKPGEIDRQRVIEAYREMKRKRNVAAE
ncbi:unnamed protein product [Haemonchus placei]|uniref:Coiled-coil domain-containing protein 137 n=1 Tax=Haemonchus placei TaxID=6290 RepID=A0A0N4X3Y2_HAEPC|nr:unnamed protein product [Haemonchus placei]